jgi:hypothetical protein
VPNLPFCGSDFGASGRLQLRGRPQPESQVARPIGCGPGHPAKGEQNSAAGFAGRPNASGAEIVGKLLSNPPSDPDVPLPQSNLATRPPADGPLGHPTIFGRQEDGGGVFGLKVPIPADRGASDRHTRSSAGLPTSD